MTVALAFATIERPHAAQRLVRSARRFFGDIPIYVADQSARQGRMMDFYEAHQVRVISMPFDSGLAASRNALVEEIREEFFLLCDDDFVLGHCSNVDAAVGVLRKAEDIAVIGGRLHDLDDAGERVRNWEMYFHYDRVNRTFTAVPIYNYSPVVREVGGLSVYMCDAVMNFSVMRRAIFSQKVRWDERIKINGEHEDFYLNLKLAARWRVGYLPTMAALHYDPVRVGAYQRSFRSRQEGWGHFLEKWDIDQHLEIGTGVRNLDQAPRQWFVDRGAPDTVPGTRVVEVMPARASPRPDAGVAIMRLRTRSRESAARGDQPQVQCSSLKSLLEAWAEIAPYEQDSPQLRFRYAAKAGGEGGLIIWSRPDAPVDLEGAAALTAQCAALRIRWFDSDGNCLVWESERIDVPMHDARYWTAFAVPIPLWPVGSRHLRFDIVSERHEERVPVATGFLFLGVSTDFDDTGHDVMALNLPRPHATGSPTLVESLGRLARAEGTPTRVLEVQSEEGMSTIDLAQAALAGVNCMLFLDWSCLGRRLMALALSASMHEPSQALIPSPQGGTPQLIGILESGEGCRFSLSA